MIVNGREYPEPHSFCYGCYKERGAAAAFIKLFDKPPISICDECVDKCVTAVTAQRAQK